MQFSIPYALRIAATGALIVGVQHAASANTFRIGIGSNCTHSDLTTAIRDAKNNPGHDTVLLNQQSVPAGRNFAITAQDLTIRGGYEFCGAPDPVFDKTNIVGRRNGGSIFTITGGGVVTLENLLITGGDTPTGNGGAISFVGSPVANSVSELRLKELNLEGNRAGVGGGVAFTAANGEPAFLTLGSGVVFLDNTAVEQGGGLFLRGNAKLEAMSERLAFHRNNAKMGGAIHIEQPASADIGSARFDTNDTFFDNAAYNGGAISIVAPLTGSKSIVKLFSIVPDRPLQFRRNAAFGPDADTPGRGGALYVSGIATNDGPSVEVCLGAVNFIDNMGEMASLAHVAGGRFGQCPDRPLPGPALHLCEPRSLCSRYEANAAGGWPDSSIIDVFNGSRIELRSVRLNGNVFAGSLIRSSGNSNAGILISNSEVGGNLRVDDGANGTQPGYLFELDNTTSLDIRYSTVAHNASVAGESIQAAVHRTGDASPRPLTRLTASIVHQPGMPLVSAPVQAVYAAVQIERVLVAQRDSWMGAATPDLLVGDPGFVGATDRHLLPGSIAVDARRDDHDQPRDLDYNERFDVRSKANNGGRVDLGAFEYQDPDFLFGDGLEAPE